jgi:hypothetical protein
VSTRDIVEKNGRRRTRLDLLGDTEIGDLDTSFVVDEDVGALYVSVDDALLVQVGESLQCLTDEDSDQGLLERAVVAEQGGDGPTWDVFEEDVEVAGVDGRVCGAKDSGQRRGE